MDFQRHRRTRSSSALRALVAETHLSPAQLIQPIFVEEGLEIRTPIREMPGVDRFPEKLLGDRVREIQDNGISAVILFGVSHHKDATGSDTMKEDGLVARMTRAAKGAGGDMIVIADLCVCEYTDHGHCGPIVSDEVANDEAIHNLGLQAVVVANAGADIIAPSSMMDGQVAAIRQALDNARHHQAPIMSYSSKFSSALYGPFRVAGGTSLKGSRSKYMMDYRNSREALRESLADVDEGADILMVKPGLHYLDVIRDVREATLLPLCGYHVSGEYAMWKFAAEAGAIDADSVLLETMTAFKRAGADMVITYAAEQVAHLLKR